MQIIRKKFTQVDLAHLIRSVNNMRQIENFTMITIIMMVVLEQVLKHRIMSSPLYELKVACTQFNIIYIIRNKIY